MPATGDINVTIYRGNRELWTGGRVRLQLLDPFADREKVLVSHSTRAGAQTVMLKGAPADRGQRYSLMASVRGHRDAALYPLQPIPGGIRHTAVMLVRKDPEPDFSPFSYDWLLEQSPAFHAALQASDISEAAFGHLPPERRAAALNIEAKLRATTLAGVPAVNFVRRIEGVEGIHQDRIYALVAQEMPDQVRAEVLQHRSFTELPGWANELFHSGYPVSFKQRVPFGSLQLSFAAAPVDGLLKADIDIDLFTDIGHFGEVVRNRVTRLKTDPYTVYVQLFDQRIFPHYLLNAA